MTSRNLKALPAIASGARPDTGPLALLLPAKDLLLNRDLSLLRFHGHVLDEALDQSLPLLERLKFLAIFASNIDEFYMIRVSALMESLAEGVTDQSPDGISAADLLREINARVRPMVLAQMRCLTQDVIPQLAARGIVIADYESLTKAELEDLHDYFSEHVFPVLIPFAVDPAHPFPFISNGVLNLGFMLEQTDSERHGSTGHKRAPQFAYLQVPDVLPRLVPVGNSGSKFVLLEDLIGAHAGMLFEGVRAGVCHAFRMTRDADLEIREEEANDLLSVIERQLPKRRFGTPVRLEVAATMPAEMVEYLRGSVGLAPEDVFIINGPLKIGDLMRLYALDRPELKFAPLRLVTPAALQESNIFEAIKAHDILLHHPYNPYSAVTDFIQTAAADKDVLAIKICLYRTGSDSPIAEALLEASEKGKQVAAVIELKARFDEENNIEWAKRLEHAGVHVTYGRLGLKTHCKISMVLRRERGALRRYTHVATGNYNPGTSAVYTDLGLLTADDEIGADVADLFNYLTGNLRPEGYRQLLVAPFDLRARLMELIERETRNAAAGRPSRIIIKINRLTDTKVICALYRASQAGVPVDLIVRGTCMLRPGVPGLSETINVRSIVGRFLEHSRIYYFANGGEDAVYIGSSDIMPRNFDRRVEVLAPVRDRHLVSHLKDEVLGAYLRDNSRARVLHSDGEYHRLSPLPGDVPLDSQLFFEGRAGA